MVALLDLFGTCCKNHNPSLLMSFVIPGQNAASHLLLALRQAPKDNFFQIVQVLILLAAPCIVLMSMA